MFDESSHLRKTAAVRTRYSDAAQSGNYLHMNEQNVNRHASIFLKSFFSSAG